MRKGDVIKGPDGIGYEFVIDLNKGDVLTTAHVRAIGGAPEPVVGDPIPEWLWEGLRNDRS